MKSNLVSSGVVHQNFLKEEALQLLWYQFYKMGKNTHKRRTIIKNSTPMKVQNKSPI